jgi:hypothetical protein
MLAGFELYYIPSFQQCLLFLEQVHLRLVSGPAAVFLTSMISYLLFPNLTHKTEIGTVNHGRLLLATHINQSNHLAHRQQVLGFAVPFGQPQHPVQKCWAKTILLNQTDMF